LGNILHEKHLGKAKEPPRGAAAPFLLLCFCFCGERSLKLVALAPPAPFAVAGAAAEFVVVEVFFAFALLFFVEALYLAAAGQQVHVRFLDGRDMANVYQEDVPTKFENAYELFVDADHKAIDSALIIGKNPDRLIQQALQPFDQTKLHLLISFVFTMCSGVLPFGYPLDISYGDPQDR